MDLINITSDILFNRIKSVPLRIALFMIALSLIVQVGLISHFKEITFLHACGLTGVISLLSFIPASSAELFKKRSSESEWHQNLALAINVMAILAPGFIVNRILYYHKGGLKTIPLFFFLEETVRILVPIAVLFFLFFFIKAWCIEVFLKIRAKRRKRQEVAV